jgi:hypothetical protein
MSRVIPGGGCQDGELADQEGASEGGVPTKPGGIGFTPTGLYLSATMPADRTRGGVSQSTEEAFQNRNFLK